MKKLLVIFHLYYHDHLPYYLDKLANVKGVEWDLLVTGNSFPEESVSALRKFKPDVRFLETENVGYDVWPFLRAVRETALDEYGIVIKLHTKNSLGDELYRVNGVRLTGFDWRDELVESLLRDEEQFRRVISAFDSDPSVGMVCSAVLYTRMHAPEDCGPLDREYSKFGLKIVDRRFCAGTMFAVKASLLAVFSDCDMSADMFPKHSNSHSGGTLAHIYERILSMIVPSQGYKVYTVDKSFTLYVKLFFKRVVQPAVSWIFGVDRLGEHRVKTLTLFGMKFRLDKGSD